MFKVVTWRVAARFILVVLAGASFHFMLQLITILNRCHRFPGFVYQQARFSSDHKSIEIDVRPRKRSAAVCSHCHQPAPGIRSTPGAPFRIYCPGLGGLKPSPLGDGFQRVRAR
jgi:hypothetical protein